jgi:transposase-like protein
VAPRRPPNLSDVERRTIAQVLHESGWNKSKAARRLGVSRTQLYGRLRKYRLETARTPQRASQDSDLSSTKEDFVMRDGALFQYPERFVNHVTHFLTEQ